MIRPTFSSVLNSVLPDLIGYKRENRTAIATYVNDVQQRLLFDPLQPDEGWEFCYVTMNFNLNVDPNSRTAYVRTPAEIARIIVLDICNAPRFLRNGFYEYLQFGTGHRPRGCSGMLCDLTQAFDRPNVATLVPFPTTAPQRIRIYPTDNADVGKRVILQGPDQNGITVLGTDASTGAASLGETVLLGFPFTQSVNSFQDITGILKDATKGPVKFFTVDSSGNQTLLSSMEPNETSANYRQYLFAGLPQNCCNLPGGAVQVFAQAKLDFVPVVADTDYLTVPNVPALIEEAQAYRYSRFDTAAAAQLEQKHHTKALQLLNGQIDHYQGKVRTAVSVPLFGSQPLTRQPR